MTARTHVVTWLWGQSLYGPHYVDRLAAGVRRNTSIDVRLICVTDNPMQEFSDDVDVVAGIIDPELTRIKGCFARLRLFCPFWQAQLGIVAGDRVVNMDLDMIVTGNIDPILDRTEPFVILQGVNDVSHPTPFNGSLWSFTAGHRPDVWRGFSIEEAEKLPKKEFADDQAWFYARMPAAASYSIHDGVFCYFKRSWPGGTQLPWNARIVAFPGHRDPKDFRDLSWVEKHWIGESAKLPDGAAS